MKKRFYSTRETLLPWFRAGLAAWLPGRASTVCALIVAFTTANLAFGQEVGTTALSAMIPKSTRLAALDSTKEISVVLSLPLADPQGAAAFVQKVSDPKDPLFRKYLTPEEFAAKFGANAADYAALKKWAVGNGLTVSQESTARIALTVRGTVGQLQTLFQTQLDVYQSPDGKQFYSASVKPTIPNTIASKVSGVIGLTDSVQYAPLVRVSKTFGENPAAVRADVGGGTGPGGAFGASDLRSLYEIQPFGHVAPQTVAVFEQGGFFASDVEKYLTTMKLPQVPVTFVSVNKYNGTVDSLDIELEAVLDIDMVIGINPAVKEVLVYEDGTDTFQVALLDALTKVADDNKAQTLSISYGVDEIQQTSTQMTAENAAFTQLAAQGIGVMVSAGDGGAYGRTGDMQYPATLNAPDPGSQPLVTCVGGTSLFTGPNGIYGGEVVWNALGTANGGATGGGVSSQWTIPSYQLPSYVTGNGGSGTMRNVPDIAAVGDPGTGVAVYSKMNGGWLQVGGTSASAPIWAGYYSVLDAAADYLGIGRLGQFNPTLYAVGWGTTVGLGAFYLSPVLDGNNGDPSIYGGTAGYFAGLGYSNCAGSGTPWGTEFTYRVLTASRGGIAPSGFVFYPNVLTRTSAKVHWTPSSSATGYVLLLFDETPPRTLVTYLTKKNTFQFTGLKSGDTYLVFAYAVNSGGATEEVDNFNLP